MVQRNKKWIENQNCVKDFYLNGFLKWLVFSSKLRFFSNNSKMERLFKNLSYKHLTNFREILLKNGTMNGFFNFFQLFTLNLKIPKMERERQISNSNSLKGDIPIYDSDTFLVDKHSTSIFIKVHNPTKWKISLSCAAKIHY